MLTIKDNREKRENTSIQSVEDEGGNNMENNNGNNKKNVLMMILLALYVICPIDLLPGPIDDIILILMAIRNHSQ